MSVKELLHSRIRGYSVVSVVVSVYVRKLRHVRRQMIKLPVLWRVEESLLGAASFDGMGGE